MGRGPLELIAVEYPGAVPGRALAPELRRLVDAGVIKIIDIAFVMKDADGTVTAFEISEREGDDDFEALDEVVQTIDGFIADDDIAEIGQDLEPGMTASLLLFEHAWMRELREIVSGAGGEVVMTERIPAVVADAVESVRARA
jgi:uncharacterized membrane protein